MRFSETWCDTDSFPVADRCFFESPEGLQRISEIAIGLGEIGFEGNGSCNVDLGDVGLAGLMGDYAQKVKGKG